MIKTYNCPIHGEFEHECRITDKELKLCPKVTCSGYKVSDPSYTFTHYCDQPVTRVFKLVNHSWKTEGFAGKGF